MQKLKMTSSKCTPSFGYCSFINNINTGWNASILSSLLHKISYDWLLSRRDLYHSWWAISPIYTTVVKDAIRRLQYSYPNLFLYLMLCFGFIPNRVIPLLFMLCFSFIPELFLFYLHPFSFSQTSFLWFGCV